MPALAAAAQVQRVSAQRLAGQEAFFLAELQSTGRSFRDRLVAEKDPMCCHGEHLKGDALSLATSSISLPRGLQMSSHSISLLGLLSP